MMQTEDRIRAFAKDQETIMGACAMLKVGKDKGDSPEEIMSRLIAWLLMQFNGIPIKKGLN